MTLLEIALVACPSSSVGFVLGALWHARPSTDEAYPLERRRRPSMAWPAEAERRRMAR
jgi:hypothetical protein